MNISINYKNIYELFSNGSLILDKSNINFKEKIKDSNIPNNFGVYIFYKNIKSYENIIYIGKAGEISTFGDKKAQGLQKRLTNTRDNKSVNSYFQELFDFDIDKIIIEYFEIDQNFIPAYIEACLIQEYYMKNNKLPILNKSF
ncbi:hypothetical protein N5T77_05205 [Aliarcobacter cryaerophilus]|uniref:hypothetical protein n=1 Tax=Aliarcobacter cryaerophilus TaxID=28198 RepID=UPI0021B6A04B|nr:hypothetical protein [Aliarcobacter cryaerophilus]MCT7524429.1 hypothetical protein [Aliarcobacter cryaerophilus]